ncbi:MAG: hypothetical protein Q9217_002393 [Psora testacea]
MPPKTPLDENTLFLFTCLKNSDYQTNLHIDFEAVGAAWGGLSKKQAYKRFWGLKKVIEAEGRRATVSVSGTDRNVEDGEKEGNGNGSGSPAKVKGKGKGAVAAGAGKGKKRKLSEREDDVGAEASDDEGISGEVKVETEE